MAIFGRISLPQVPVSVADTSTGRQILFESPKEMFEWFTEHTDERIAEWSWFVGPLPAGGS